MQWSTGSSVYCFCFILSLSSVLVLYIPFPFLFCKKFNNELIYMYKYLGQIILFGIIFGNQFSNKFNSMSVEFSLA